MSRQRGDIHEVGPGPLFDPPIERLVGKTDPETSRRAAVGLVQSGSLASDQGLALRLLREFPGRTTPELGVMAAGREEPPWDGDGRPRRYEFWRQKLGRRLNELEKAGLIRREGARDGCSIWWPVDRGSTSA